MATPMFRGYTGQNPKSAPSRIDRTRALELRVAQLERYLTLQHEITQIIAQSSELSTALPNILRAICETTGWDFAEVWHTDRDDSIEHQLTCAATWHVPNSTFPLFEDSGRSMTFAFGKGLPGRVWASGSPAWMTNVVSDANFMRGSIAELDGLHTGLGIPIRADGEVIGAMTFFTRERRQTDADLIRILDTVGSQIGLFIERKRAEQIEHEHRCALAALEERQRLARDLHDSVTQTLFSASVIAEMLPITHQEATQAIAPYLTELHNLTRNALSEMRELLVELRPPALVDGDLPELLKNLAHSFACRSGIAVHLNAQIERAPSSDEQIAVYRIAQEALNNIWKHAAACEVSIEIVITENNLSMRIEDNGRGFDMACVPADHFGLQVMRERAHSIGASYRIESQPGNGTRIHVAR